MSNDTVNAKSLIQEQVSTMLVEPLEAQSVVLAAGPQIFNSSEPLRIPTLVDGFSPSIVGENELIPEDEAAFGEMKLMPSDRKSIKSLTRVSNELIRQAKQGVTSVLQTRLVKDVANSLDTMLLKGDGKDGGATGFLKQPNTQTAALDVNDTDSLLDMLALAASKEVTPNRWFLSGEDFYTLRKVKDKNGRYIMQANGGIDGGVGYRLFDVPVTVTNKLDKGEGALVDMKEVAVVRDIDPQVTVDTSRYLEYDQVAIRVATRYDLGLLHPEGVIVFGGGAAEA
ncbi:phage major capsid protein [Corynebacterium camporealensis]|uniref:phage major capsid protein n=1 Tax=Corynebacterium camporealensis TaxID=161896 RepID=UPI0034CD939D